MTKMPELVAFFHSMIGLAAVFIAVAAVAEPWAFGIGCTRARPIPTGNRLELFLGAAIGAITFSRLGDRLRQAARAPTSSACSRARRCVFTGQHMRQPGARAWRRSFFIVGFTFSESWPDFLLHARA